MGNDDGRKLGVSLGFLGLWRLDSAVVKVRHSRRGDLNLESLALFGRSDFVSQWGPD